MDASTIGNINDLISAMSGNGVIDLVAISGDQSQIVAVSIEGPSAQNSGMTAEQYLEAQQEQMESALEGTYTFTSTSANVTFKGLDRELPASVMNLNVDGSPLCICHAVAEKDGYFLNAIALGATQDAVTSAFENFTVSAQ